MTNTILEPHATDDRLAAAVGEHLAGTILVHGSISAPFLRCLLSRTTLVLHVDPPESSGDLLRTFAVGLGAAGTYALTTEITIPWPDVDGVLLVADDPGGVRERTKAWSEKLLDRAPILAILPQDEAVQAEIPSPDPARTVLVLRRRPPMYRRSARPPADVSVIIPTFNRPEFLVQAVESALFQDPPPAEILIADDGSAEDPTPHVASFGDRVRVLRLEHRNMAAAMNAGLAEARGELIAWLDDDDLFMPRKFALQLPSLAGSRAAFSATAHYVGDSRGIIREIGYLPEFRPEQLMRLLLRGSIFLGPTVVARRSAYEALGTNGADGPYDTSLERAADYAMWLKLAHRAQVDIVQVPLSFIRRHPGNALSEDKARAIFHSVQSSVAWLRDHVELAELVPDHERGWEPRALMERGRASIRVGLPEGAASDLKRAREMGIPPVRIDCLLALIAFEGGQMDEARTIFERALTIGGEDAEALNGLGSVELAAGHHDAAGALFRRAIDRDASDPLAIYNLGLTQERRAGTAGGNAALAALSRDLLARQTHRSALYSVDPPIFGIDRFFAGFRRETR